MTDAAFDIQGLTTLRAAAGRDPQAQLPAVAKQFETLFAQMLLKSMREATPDSGLWSGPGMSMYRNLLDQQWSQAIAKQGGLGIADMLVRQLGGHGAAGAAVGSPQNASAAAATGSPVASASDFAGTLWPALQRHAAAAGVTPEAVLAQAALETGWGAHVPHLADGSSSHNVFGIKAGADWPGARAAHNTVEFINGGYTRRTEWFRAYPSVDAAVSDYLSLMQSPRYRSALAGGGGPNHHAQALQAAGYATDPEYARKIGQLAASETFRQVVAGLKNSAAVPIKL